MLEKQQLFDLVSLHHKEQNLLLNNKPINL